MNEPKPPLTYDPSGQPVCPCGGKPMHKNGFKRRKRLMQQWRCPACRRTTETVADGASLKKEARPQPANMAEHWAKVEDWIRAGLPLILPLAVDYLIKVAGRSPLDTRR